MLVDFLAMGYTEEKFWSLSLGRYYIYRKAYYKKIREKEEADMWTAYVSACVVMADPRPSFDEVMGRDRYELDLKDQEHLTDDELNEQLIAALQQNSANYGVE